MLQSMGLQSWLQLNNNNKSFSSLFQSCGLLLVPLMEEAEREQLAKPSEHDWTSCENDEVFTCWLVNSHWAVGTSPSHLPPIHFFPWQLLPTLPCHDLATKGLTPSVARPCSPF